MVSSYKLFTRGQKHGRERVIVNVAIVTGWKLRILGYMSNGESVYIKESNLEIGPIIRMWTTLTPEVITTDWKRSKTGHIAMDASMQLQKSKSFQHMTDIKFGYHGNLK